MFCYKFIAARPAYNKGKMTHDDKVFAALKLVYRMEEAASTWANLIPFKLEITMFTTNLAKANIKLHKMKSSGGDGGRGGGGGRDSGTGRGNGNHAAGKGSGGTNDKDREWMLTRTTDTSKHPTKGYNMKWCKLCGPGCSKGTHARTPQSCKMALLLEGVTVKFECQKEIPKSQTI